MFLLLFMYIFLFGFILRSRFVVLFIRDDDTLIAKLMKSITSVEDIDAFIITIHANKKILNEVNIVGVNTKII